MKTSELLKQIARSDVEIKDALAVLGGTERGRVVLGDLYRLFGGKASGLDCVARAALGALVREFINGRRGFIPQQYEKGGQMLSEAIQTAVERQTSEPCPHCGRSEDGKWFVPCPSDDCPSHDQAAEGVE